MATNTRTTQMQQLQSKLESQVKCIENNLRAYIRLRHVTRDYHKNFEINVDN